MQVESESAGASEAEQGWPEAERRKAADRRHRPTRFWDVLLHGARRHHGRRRGESQGIYVDVYHGRDVLLVLAILLLNLADAHLTLRHLEQGGSEANPLMSRLIEFSHQTFLFEKSVVVGLWLLLLLVHKHFRLARFGLWFLLGLYLGIFFLHIGIATDWVIPWP